MSLPNEINYNAIHSGCLVIYYNYFNSLDNVLFVVSQLFLRRDGGSLVTQRIGSGYTDDLESYRDKHEISHTSCSGRLYGVVVVVYGD